MYFEDDDIPWLLQRVTARLRYEYFEQANALSRKTGNCEKNTSRQYPEFDGGTRGGSSVWLKLAKKMVVARTVDPQLFMLTSFYSARRAIGATMLTSEPMWRNYMDARLLRCSQLQMSKQTDVRTFDTSVFNIKGIYPEKRTEEAWHYVLLNNNTPIGPLFRFIVADSEGFDDIADDYYGLAIDEYITEPKLYDEMWDGKIPEDISREADVLWTCFEQGATQ